MSKFSLLQNKSIEKLEIIQIWKLRDTGDASCKLEIRPDKLSSGFTNLS
jgi:hypothetical protein